MINTTSSAIPANVSSGDLASVQSLPDYVNDHDASIMFSVSFCFLGIIGVFGTVSNIINIIIFIIQGFKDSNNISLFGISIADFGSSLMLLWDSMSVSPVLTEISKNWELVDVVYVTSSWPRIYFVRITGILTAFITIERYLCIAYPLTVRQLITPCRTIIFNISICIIMAALISPVLFSVKLGDKLSTSRNQTVIGVTYGSHTTTIINVTSPINNFFQLLSFVIVFILTIQLVYKLNNNLKWRYSKTVMSKYKTSQRRDHRVVRLVILISVNFIVCYAPGVVFFLVTRFEPQFGVNGSYKNMFSTLGACVLLCESINVSTSVFIYLSMSSKYKQVFLSLMNLRNDSRVRLTKPALEVVRKQQPSLKDEYHTFNGKEQISIFRFRTGHNRLNKHMHRLHFTVSPLWACGQDEQTVGRLESLPFVSP